LSGAPYQRHIYLGGIGGTGMSAIAVVLAELGFRVSGSDRQDSAALDKLRHLGVKVYVGHAAENIRGADVVVMSSAISPENPEIAAARAEGIPVLTRAEFIGQILADRYTLAVAGTHGKTTTTAMLAFILTEAGRAPGFIIGGVSRNLRTNARAGQNAEFVIEADEYGRMFWGLSPRLAILTNIEMDHPDYFADIEELTAAFRGFLERVQPGGCVVASGEDWRVRTVISEITAPVRIETFGLSKGLDWQARDLEGNEHGGYHFTVWHDDALFGEFDLQVPGPHNVLNAIAAIAASYHVGVSLDTLRDALLRFEGTSRRFEVKGEAAGITVVDDYAHHPTEVRATLTAARVRFPRRRLWAVFQPHTYSRFKALLRSFADSFESADRVIVTDIFAARECDTLGVHATDLVRLINDPKVEYAGSLEAAARRLLSELRSGDVVITLGAGDGYRIGEEVLARLQTPGGGRQ
jgi:UDP-N-acetylmuramate--alanine ligase